MHLSILRSISLLDYIGNYLKRYETGKWFMNCAISYIPLFAAVSASKITATRQCEPMNAGYHDAVVTFMSMTGEWKRFSVRRSCSMAYKKLHYVWSLAPLNPYDIIVALTIRVVALSFFNYLAISKPSHHGGTKRSFLTSSVFRSSIVYANQNSISFSTLLL